MDAQSITALRTAASATVAMQAVARPAPRRVAVIGTSMQASAQLQFLTLLGETDVTIGARHRDSAETLSAWHGVESVATVEAAVRCADIVFCCTSSPDPVLRRSWQADGAHVGSVGGGHGWELDAETIHSAALYTEWPGAAGEPNCGLRPSTGTPPAGGAWCVLEDQCDGLRVRRC